MLLKTSALRKVGIQLHILEMPISPQMKTNSTKMRREERSESARARLLRAAKPRR